MLEAEGFDEFVEGRCAKFYAANYGRPSVTPGIYFRSLLIGYFEGIGAERGIAWRLADSLALRRFVGIGLDENTPDHSTISRTRRLIDVDTHREVFGWVPGILADRGLLKGERIAIDATTLEANPAMRSIVRRDTWRVGERRFAHCYETGGRCHPRGRGNILKRQLVHVGAFNLSLILRQLLGAGTPRELRNRFGRLVWFVYLLFQGRINENWICRNWTSTFVAKCFVASRVRLPRQPCRKPANCATGC